MSLGGEPGKTAGRAHFVFLACAVVSSLTVNPAAGQQRPFAEDAFKDPSAGPIYRAAVDNWRSVDESIVRYTARIQQRIAAALRTPLKDRILYRNETAVRAFWDRDYDAVVQVLGTRSQYPGRSIAVREGDLDFLDDLPFDEPFEPGGDRLFFGISESGDDEAFEARDDEFWFAHPLASGADTLYQFESGDTLTLSLPDGRRLQAIQLDVLPRVADVHRITGSLWIEPETGALVRGVYRLSKQFDAIRDIPEMQEEEAEGSFKYVPGLFKPWTFDLTMVAVDYALWDFEVWLPRSMRIEGEVGAGILKIPVSMDVAYEMESVTTAAEEQRMARAEAAGETPPGGEVLQEVHFESRAEAMEFIAQLLSEEAGKPYEPMGRGGRSSQGRRSLLIAPQDRESVTTSPDLPPPIWEEAAAFPSDEQLEEYVQSLADLPAPTVQGIPWSFNWGWARPDLVRYNRVEGPALGGKYEAALGGPYSLTASGFFGFSDLQPKARLNLQRSTVLRRLTLGVYRENVATDPAGGYLGFGNTLDAFFFGRDNGEYFRSTGVDFAWSPPVGARDSFRFRAYAERQEQLDVETSFAFFHMFDSGWRFRPNVLAADADEVGGELRISPWWGGDPSGGQIGLELYGQGGRWWADADEVTRDYGRASAVLRGAYSLADGRWRAGFETGAGTTWGQAPLQRAWFLGGAQSLRGYPASVAVGTSFGRGRLEIARSFDEVGSLSLFGDVGWAGNRDDIDSSDLLYSVGLGGSLLDGLIRFDLSQGLTGPRKQFRIDLYLDAIL
ncbi:MAG: hypothetical protein HKN73_18865 [Gemmatimonadetes bacterium]|nr:hypothetical protein [Gemmatimonadota bacterium]